MTIFLSNKYNNVSNDLNFKEVIMKLGVHDLLIREAGKTNQDVFNDTKKMVVELDKLGYYRYWFAEHHGFENLLSVAPEILATYFLSNTENIVIGTGGTMIMHYSPLKVAETFKTMAELAPGRVDLGIGRAPGSGPLEIRALNQGYPNKSSQLYDEIKIILDYLEDKEPNDPVFSRVKAIPMNNEKLVMPWMLGSTGQAAPVAAEWGMPYSHAKFFAVETPDYVFKDYKENFKASSFADKPYISMSYKMLIADDKDELEYLGKAFDYFHLQQARGRSKGLVSPEDVKDYEFDLNEKALLQKSYDSRFILKGTKKEIAGILYDEISKFDLDEILAFTPIYGVENRINTYKKLKEIFD